MSSKPASSASISERGILSSAEKRATRADIWLSLFVVPSSKGLQAKLFAVVGEWEQENQNEFQFSTWRLWRRAPASGDFKASDTSVFAELRTWQGCGPFSCNSYRSKHQVTLDFKDWISSGPARFEIAFNCEWPFSFNSKFKVFQKIPWEKLFS